MGKNKKNVSALGQAISDFTSLMTAATEYKKATTATTVEVQAEVKNRIKKIEDANNRVDVIESALKAAGKSDAEVATILNSVNLTKIDLTEQEKILTIQVQNDLNNKKTEEFNNGFSEMLGLVSMMQAMSTEMQNAYAPAPAPQPQVVVVPAEPSIPQQFQAAAPQTYQQPQSQWERHSEVTHDARAARFSVEQDFKNGKMTFKEYIAAKAAINMEAFSNHTGVTATKKKW